MKKLLIMAAIGLLTLLNTAQAFEKPSKTQRLQTLSRANIDTALQGKYTVVYQVPVEFGGSQGSLNTVALAKPQYKSWKSWMKGVNKKLKKHKINQQGARDQASTWIPNRH